MNTSKTYKDSSEVSALIELSRRSFDAEETGNKEVLDALLTADFKIVRSNLSMSDKQAMLVDVPANAGKGRVVDEVSAKIYEENAVVTSHVTTRNQDPVGQFWNTQVFVKQGTQWRCRIWQVVRLV
ncbi:MAG: nuclear transport factor 2 family protein [Pyrinomonadaceae bacterium]